MDSELPSIAVFSDLDSGALPLVRQVCDAVFAVTDWHLCDRPGEADCLLSNREAVAGEGQLLIEWPPDSAERSVSSLVERLRGALWQSDGAAGLIWRQAMQITGPDGDNLSVQAALTGSRAWVYRARCDASGGLVVAKAQPDAPERLRREAKVLAELPAGLAPRYYRLDDWLGQPLLLMEDCGSRNFANVVAESGGNEGDLPPAALESVLDVLAAVHAAGRVHGDLKPEHVLFPEPGRAVLIDWGLSGAGAPAEIERGQWRGTPLYMAPELFEGAAPSPRSDLYALGVMLMEALLGGFPPAWASLPASALHAAVLAHWQSHPLADSHWSSVLRYLVAHSPERRPATVEDFRRESFSGH